MENFNLFNPFYILTKINLMSDKVESGKGLIENM